MSVLRAVQNTQIHSITVRLTFLAHSFRMRPIFQGLPWFECDGLGEEDELLTLRVLMSYIYGTPILDVSRSHTTTQHSR